MLLEEGYPPDIRVKKEVRALIQGGHQVFILSCASPDRPGREEVDGAEVIRRPVDSMHDGVRGWMTDLQYLLTYVHRGWSQAASEVIESENIEALHAHDLPLVKTAIKLGERYSLPVIADLHENWPEAKRYYREGTLWNNAKSNPKLIVARLLKSYWRLKQFERYSVRHADRVIAVVEEGRQHYIQDCDANPESVHVISNVVDLDIFDSAEIHSLDYDDEFIISYVGTLSGRHRGLDMVLRAVPTVIDEVENLRVLIVGPESNYSRELRQLSAELKIEEQVTFTGRVPFDQVPSYIAASDICTVPHRKNPHTETTVPHKLFQYMAMRKPVLVTDITPLARIVRGANCGVVVPSEDPSEMADAIKELYRNSNERSKLGMNGRSAVENTYNWRIEGKKLCELYSGV